MLAAYSLFIFAFSGLAFSQGSNNTTIRLVTVGYGGLLRFNPEVVNAAVGTQVLFQYYPRNHSVAQGSFASPCSPLENGFFSGYVPSAAGEASSSFVITVQDTNPIYYYCSQARHCQAGMVGIINPLAAENASYAIYNGTAALSPNNVTPANGVQGGTLVTSGQNATSSNSSTTGTGTPTATGAGSASGTSSGSTSGTASGTASGTGNAGGSTTGSAPATSSTTAAAARIFINGILGGLGMMVGIGMGVL